MLQTEMISHCNRHSKEKAVFISASEHLVPIHLLLVKLVMIKTILEYEDIPWE